MSHFALFETAIGTAGIAWGEAGLIGVHLPERDPENNRRSFQRRFPGVMEAAVPRHLQATVEGIRALMRGEKVDLSAAPLDIARVPAFAARV
jgi:methylated-DNA-[protein]-cysteine S-methyltransferase